MKLETRLINDECDNMKIVQQVRVYFIMYCAYTAITITVFEF